MRFCYLCVMANELVKYMEARLCVLSRDVRWVEEEAVTDAIKGGRVGRAPISIYRQDGEVYWLKVVPVEESLDGLAKKALPYCGSTREPPLVGSVETLQLQDGFDEKTATLGLVRARERGWVEEYQRGGHSHFVVPEMRE